MPAIPATFINLFTLRRLQQTTLPALPCPGDQVYLDELGYEVAFLSWQLAPTGLQHVEIMLRPFRDTEDKHLFEYPAERTRWPNREAS